MANRALELGGEDVPELTHIASTFSNGIFYREPAPLTRRRLPYSRQGKQDFRASLSGIQPRNSGTAFGAEGEARAIRFNSAGYANELL